jgi:hypothetical protein
VICLCDISLSSPRDQIRSWKTHHLPKHSINIKTNVHPCYIKEGLGIRGNFAIIRIITILLQGKKGMPLDEQEN